MWGWIAGVAVLVLIGFLIIAGWNNNGTTASNGASPSATATTRTPHDPADHHGLRLFIDAAADAGTFDRRRHAAARSKDCTFPVKQNPAPHGRRVMVVASL